MFLFFWQGFNKNRLYYKVSFRGVFFITHGLKVIQKLLTYKKVGLQQK